MPSSYGYWQFSSYGVSLGVGATTTGSPVASKPTPHASSGVATSGSRRKERIAGLRLFSGRLSWPNPRLS